jgi:hypothetical protein
VSEKERRLRHMKRNIAEELKKEFAPIIEGDAVIDIWDCLENWRKRVNGDIYCLASIMVDAFSELVFEIAEDMESETKTQTDLPINEETNFKTKIIYLFEK